MGLSAINEGSKISSSKIWYNLQYLFNLISNNAGTTTNADTVDLIHAASTPTANYLYPLNSNSVFPTSVLPNGTYIKTVDGTAGKGDYTTIEAALAAITDNATTKRYIILVYPGTYAPPVAGYTLKDYVSIIGVDKQSCLITNTLVGGAAVFNSTGGVGDYSSYGNFTLTTTANRDLFSISNNLSSLFLYNIDFVTSAVTSNVDLRFIASLLIQHCNFTFGESTLYISGNFELWDTTITSSATGNTKYPLYILPGSTTTSSKIRNCTITSPATPGSAIVIYSGDAATVINIENTYINSNVNVCIGIYSTAGTINITNCNFAGSGSYNPIQFYADGTTINIDGLITSSGAGIIGDATSTYGTITYNNVHNTGRIIAKVVTCQNKTGYFNKLVLGKTADNSAMAATNLHIVADDATTNAIVEAVRITHSTSGTATANIGTSLTLYSEDASGNIDKIGELAGIFPVATHSGQTTRMIIKPAIDSVSSIQLQNSSGVNILNIDSSNSRIGIITSSPSTTIGFDGDADRTIALERNTTTVGKSLYLKAGGSFAGLTDSAGGDIYITSGISTGTGISRIYFQTATPAAGTGSSDNTPSTKMTILGSGFVGCGISLIPLAPLHIAYEDAATTTATEVLRLQHTTTATAGAAFGTSQSFYGEDASGNLELIGEIIGMFPTATHSGQTSRIAIKPAINSVSGFSVQNASAANVFTVDTVNSRVGIGGVSAPTNNLSFTGTGARKIWLERNTTADTAGNTLTIEAGGATASATDKAGGDLIFQSGISTGTGISRIYFYTETPGTAGTGSNTQTKKMTIYGTGTSQGLIEIEETVTLAANTVTSYAGGITIDPAYTAAAGKTLDEHVYIDLNNPATTNVTISGAPVFKLDAALGTHKATFTTFNTTDSGAQTTAWDGGLLLDINGDYYKIPFVRV